MARPAVLGETPFAVVDVETTGIYPGGPLVSEPLAAPFPCAFLWCVIIVTALGQLAARAAERAQSRYLGSSLSPQPLPSPSRHTRTSGCTLLSKSQHADARPGRLGAVLLGWQNESGAER